MTKNMTTGSPFKLIMSFALPLLLGNLLQQTYNLIDAAIVGRFLGSDALASVGASSSVQFFGAWFFAWEQPAALACLLQGISEQGT